MGLLQKTGNSIYGSNNNDMFGWSTSTGDGNILAVGAYQDDNNGTDAGLVKIYEWMDQTGHSLCQ